MALEYRAGYCPRCGPIKLERKGTNHILHLLLTVVTFGVWIIFWIGNAIKFGGWRCSKCGNTKVSGHVPKGAGTPKTVDTEDRVKCPECAELVLADARKCKHCGVALTPRLANGA